MTKMVWWHISWRRYKCSFFGSVFQDSAFGGDGILIERLNVGLKSGADQKLRRLNEIVILLIYQQVLIEKILLLCSCAGSTHDASKRFLSSASSAWHSLKLHATSFWFAACSS